MTKNNFEKIAMEVFSHQYKHCQIYHDYCKHLSKTPDQVANIYQIPFLPIQFFKSHTVKTGDWEEECIFRSSGTTSMTLKSCHYIKSLVFYQTISKKIAEQYLGSIQDYVLLALLPSYQLQQDSSLIAMVDYLMRKSLPKSDYFPDGESLQKALKEMSSTQKKLIIGVPFSLLEGIVETSISNAILMETGGMKGRRKEMTREELHKKLKANFLLQEIHSEYGMTELTSQAYGKNGIFQFPKWVKVLIRDIHDPFYYATRKKIGGVNIIDLANIDTCAFIETQDLGTVYPNHSFEILGRMDHSDVRGCNLMIQ